MLPDLIDSFSGTVLFWPRSARADVAKAEVLLNTHPIIAGAGKRDSLSLASEKDIPSHGASMLDRVVG